MQTISVEKTHGGIQGVYSHRSDACDCEMSFAVFVPPQATERQCPLVWYLSGLTCTHANVMEKGEYRRLASQLGLIVICPDTSPRGDGVPDESGNWQFGLGAGFYLDATQEPFSDNYRMYSYIVEELPRLVQTSFRVDMARQGIFGHSMGGHGALTIALKNPDRFRSCSAFAPISHPIASGWSRPAFEKYLGTDAEAWRRYDSCALIEDATVSRSFWWIKVLRTLSWRTGCVRASSKAPARLPAFRSRSECRKGTGTRTSSSRLSCTTICGGMRTG